MKPILQISKLSKKYKIHPHLENQTLAENLARLPQKIRSLFKRKEEEEFWALRDIDLEIRQGDQVGIIGRNGAGKSTLLKIISKITAPTSGSVKSFGRVSSLLEVGTGFHLELTGRENIFLNGAILGLKRREIQKRFDEIVAFAEVEKFLDNPVKRYSSGMLARLGFAVAAHLDPDILIVDEVLAVGDKPFQEKCLKNLREQSRMGRTVIFVSHNAASTVALCEKGVFLEKGEVRFFGPIEECMHLYKQSYAMSDKRSDDHFHLFGVHLSDGKLTLEIEVFEPGELEFGIWDRNHYRVAGSHVQLTEKGRFTAFYPLDLSLLHGDYTLKVGDVTLELPVYSQKGKWVIHGNG